MDNADEGVSKFIQINIWKRFDCLEMLVVFKMSPTLKMDNADEEVSTYTKNNIYESKY